FLPQPAPRNGGYSSPSGRNRAAASRRWKRRNRWAARNHAIVACLRASAFRLRRRHDPRPPHLDDAARPPYGRHESRRADGAGGNTGGAELRRDRKSTRLNSSHVKISYAVFCLKKKTHTKIYSKNNMIKKLKSIYR